MGVFLDPFFGEEPPNDQKVAVTDENNSEMRAGYSIFDSALFRNLEAEWIFPQEKATLQDLQTATCESKML
jgi:hypothetical protein